MIPGIKEMWYARREMSELLWAEFSLHGELTSQPDGVRLVRAQAERLESRLIVPRQPCSNCGGGVDPAQVKASPAAQEAFLRE